MWVYPAQKIIMKKIFFALLTTVIVFTANAQVQRKRATQPASDSTTAINANENRQGKKEMLKELNLTKEQKVKMKELRQKGKTKMVEIQNDSKLSDADRQTKLRALKAEQLKKTMALLNDEQKEKMKQMRKEKIDQKGEDVMMDEQ